MKPLFLSVSLAILGTTAMAQDTGDVTVGAGLSSLGFNLEAGYHISPQLRARGLLAGGFGADFDESDGGDTIEGELTIGGLAAIADYYPTASGWRISGGLLLSNTDLDATGNIQGNDADLSAEFKNAVSPMITTGYDLRFGQGWAFTSEIGVVFSGGIDLEFEADDPAAQSVIDNDEDVQDAIDALADLTVLPYLSLGFSYQF